MKTPILLTGLLFAINSFAQTIEPIVVTTQSINIIGSLAVANWMNEHPKQAYPYFPKLYYGFSAGDEIVIDFTTENKKGTQGIEVSEWESKSVVYSNHQFQALDGVRIKVPKTAVYKFEFGTNFIFDRQCKVSIKRIPATEATKDFTCNVTWKTVTDTSFTMVAEKRKVSTVYEPVTVQSPINYFVNSWTALGGKRRITFPITLPQNTVEWYYTFGATRNDDDVRNTQAGMRLFADLSKAIDKTGILSVAINAISRPPGADYCDVFLLDPKNNQAFLNNDDWTSIEEGTRINLMSGVVPVKNCCKNNSYYIGFRNRDMSNGIHVIIEIVAIVKKEIYQTVQVKKPVAVTTKKIPVFGA
jgi:hypothetical protein